MIKLLIKRDCLMTSNEQEAHKMYGGPRDIDGHTLTGKRGTENHKLDPVSHENDQEKYLQVSDFIFHILRRIT